MNCDQTQPLLEAFADGELGRGTAWRVRRHLAGCPACAAELAELQHLDARIRAWRDVSAPAGMQTRLAAALPSLPPAAAVPPRRARVTRRAAVGLAGIAAAAVAFFWLLPGQPGRPTIAFADVEQAMQQVQMVSYDMNSHVYDAQGQILPGVMEYSLRRWLRRTPAADAQYDAVMHEWHLEDARGTVWYSQRLNKYLEQPPNGDIDQSVNKYMRRLTEPPIEATPEELRSSNFHFQPWQRYETTLDGQSCLMFTQDSDRINGKTTDEFSHATIWVDVQTLHVIRIEIVGDPTPNVAPNAAKGVVERTVFDNFHYNETPPLGVFDWSPPSGANVQNAESPTNSAHAWPLPGSPIIAFADVEKAMQQVQIVSYDINTRVYDAQGQFLSGVNTMSSHHWLRRTPAASAWYDLIMQERHLEDARGDLSYSQRLNKYLKEPLVDGSIEQIVNKRMHLLTESPTGMGTDRGATYSDPSVQLTLTDWQQQGANLNGVACRKFTRNILRTTKGGYNNNVRHDNAQLNVWVNAKTLHVIHIEIVGNPTLNVAPNGDKGVVQRTIIDNFHYNEIDNFHYNEPPQSGVFDWSPPPGAKVEGHW